MARTYPTEAVVLRSLRLGEADRIVHLYTRERGRIGAVAKGIRKTKSRFGGRLEPLSHVAMQLHQGSGELQTVTGVDLVRSHSAVREDPYRLNVGLIGAEAMLRLFTEQERNERAFTALTRFLDVLDDDRARASRPALDPLALSFQLKLLWLSGYLPHLTSCAECGADDVRARRLLAAGRRRGLPRRCANGSLPLCPAGLAGIEALLSRRRSRMRTAAGSQRASRARRARRRHRVVRVPRRLPAADAERLSSIACVVKRRSLRIRSSYLDHQGEAADRLWPVNRGTQPSRSRAAY